jgi:hypothetical protein
MQTFLPLPDVKESLQCLDARRLGKQRVEAFQICRALQQRKAREKAAWVNHPAVIMWVDYDEYLKYYFNCSLQEWERRGYRNEKLVLVQINESKLETPWWFGNQEVHASHRANLLRKDPQWYRQFGWSEIPVQGYCWPTRDHKIRRMTRKLSNDISAT